MDLHETWPWDGRWGRSDTVKLSLRSLQGPRRNGPKTRFFVTNTAHRFLHFCFTDFYKIWSEHVNLGDLESLHSGIFSGEGHFPRKMIVRLDFGRYSQHLGSITQKLSNTEKLTKKRHICRMPSIRWHQSNRPKHITWAVASSHSDHTQTTHFSGRRLMHCMCIMNIHDVCFDLQRK